MTQFSQLWWKQFHGPAKFLEEFCRSATQGGCFFLRHTDDIPWYYQFQDLVFEGLQREVGHFRLEEPTDLPDNAGSQWFAERFLPQHASNFLSTTKLSTFLVQTGGLRGRILWLRTGGQEQLQTWLELLSQFAVTPAAKDSIVILEGTSLLPTRRKVKLFDADKAFTPFDSVQLCTIAAKESSCQALFKPYLTHLLDQLCGPNPAMVELLLEQGESLVRNPEEGAACLNLDPDTVVRRVRRAQLLLLLPIVEDIRVHLLTQLYDQCKALLPIEENYARYQNIYREVYELEVRHLFHSKNHGELQMTNGQWKLTTAAYNAGNHFRHDMTPMSFCQVEELLRLSNQIS